MNTIFIICGIVFLLGIVGMFVAFATFIDWVMFSSVVGIILSIIVAVVTYGVNSEEIERNCIQGKIPYYTELGVKDPVDMAVRKCGFSSGGTTVIPMPIYMPR